MLNFKLNVLFKEKKIKTNLSELVQYDYNSVKLKFTFDIVEIKYIFKLINPDNNIVIVKEIKNNELIFGPGVLDKEGYYFYEISAYGTNSKLTNYAKGNFFVREILVNTDEIVEPDDRVPVLDQLINDVSTLETTVNANETARQNNEEARVSNENTRISNEETRQSNEGSREEYIDQLKQDVADGKFDGYTPVKGVDYYTEAEKEELKDEITDDIVGEATSQFNQNAAEKTTAYNNNASSKLTAYNDNATDKLTAYNTNHTEKLQAYNDNASDKLVEYNDNAEEKTNDFNNNAESYSKRLDRAEMVYNALPKVEGEGTSLTLDGTAEAPMKMSLAPSELEQATTTGKNLLNGINPTSVNVNTNTIALNNNIITISSTTTSTIPYASWEFQVEENDVIRLNGIIKNSNGRIVRQTYDGSTWSGYIERNYIDGSTVSTLSYTVPSGIEKARFNLYANNAIPSGDANSSYENVIVTKNNEDMTYEPYTGSIPAPNPEFPMDIHTISGDNEIIVENKNLFDKDNVIYVNNKILNDNGVEVSDSTGGYTNMYIPVKPNTEYTISGLPTGGGKRIYFFDNSKTFISRTITSTVATRTFTTPSNCEYIDIQYYISGNDFNTYQLELGSTTTSYVEHQEQSLPLNLGDLEYCKIGDYEDEFVYNTTDTSLELNKWYLKKNFYKKIFNGTEKIDYTQAYHNFQYTLPARAISANSRDVKCNYFVSGSKVRIGNSTAIMWVFDSNEYYENSVDKFKQDLANKYNNGNPMVFYYPLATPQYILLNDTLQSQLTEIYKWTTSYQDQTNISQVNNDLPFVIKASAIYDLNKLLTRVETLEAEV